MIGKWVQGTDGLNIEIIPFEKRVDAGVWQGTTTYRIVDVFTAVGSWEPSDQFGAIEQWAADKYHSGADFDGAGADHNFFIKVLDKAGNFVPKKLILFWTGERPDDSPNTVRRNAKEKDGTENIPMFPDRSGAMPEDVARALLEGAVWTFEGVEDGMSQPRYNPSQGEHGPWSGAPFGRADVVSGAGMPLNQHISVFAVFQEMDDTDEPDPEPEPDPSYDDEMAFSFNPNWMAYSLLVNTDLVTKYTPVKAVTTAFAVADEFTRQRLEREA